MSVSLGRQNWETSLRYIRQARMCLHISLFVWLSSFLHLSIWPPIVPLSIWPSVCLSVPWSIFNWTNTLLLFFFYFFLSGQHRRHIIDKQIIVGQTGHRSTAIRADERTSNKHIKVAICSHQNLYRLILPVLVQLVQITTIF